MKTSIHVFHCSEADCRWARGVEYSDETADESLEAAAAMRFDRSKHQDRCQGRQRADAGVGEQEPGPRIGLGRGGDAIVGASACANHIRRLS
jgi:hypothetical protein